MTRAARTLLALLTVALIALAVHYRFDVGAPFEPRAIADSAELLDIPVTLTEA